MKPVFASTLPASAAPLIMHRQVTADGDPTNPYSYPFLKDLARSLAQDGVPAGFILGVGSRPGQGIDIRTMLLYEKGILKTPVRLFAPRKISPESSLPSLSVSGIPDSTGKMPKDSGPKLEAEIESQKPQSGIRAEAPRQEDTPSLNIDFNRFKIDLSKSELKNEITTRLSENSSTVSMIQPTDSDRRKSTQNEDHNSFRFWTVPPPVAARPKSALLSADESSSAFGGSFVMMSPTGLKAIDGRKFFMKSGQSLVCSKGKSVKLDTALAMLELKPGSLAFVEIPKQGLLRIRVLESENDSPSVLVKLKNNTKEEIELSGKDDLLIADHELSQSDRSIQSKSETRQDGEPGTSGNGKKSHQSGKAAKAKGKIDNTENSNSGTESSSNVSKGTETGTIKTAASSKREDRLEDKQAVVETSSDTPSAKPVNSPARSEQSGASSWNKSRFSIRALLNSNNFFKAIPYVQDQQQLETMRALKKRLEAI